MSLAKSTPRRIIESMNKQLTKQRREDDTLPKKHPRHPLTMENSREETIRRMRSFPERAERLRELIRALREADSR